MAGSPWTGEQDALLARLYPTDTPVAEIARRLGRPIGAVYLRAAGRGLSRGGKSGRPKSRAWSGHEVGRLRLLARHHDCPEIGRRLGRSTASVYEKLCALGLATRQASMRWTPRQEALLRALYPDHTNEHIARRLKRPARAVVQKALKLGLRKSAAYFKEHGGRFAKGIVPWNKGIAFDSGGRSVQTRFKKGQHPHTWKPVGTLRVSADGYLQQKVSDTGYPPRDWVGVHRLVWERAHGAVPEGHAVAFRSGRASTELADITPEALELVTRNELMRRNSIHNMPPELAELVQLRGALNRQINRRSMQP